MLTSLLRVLSSHLLHCFLPITQQKKSVLENWWEPCVMNFTQTIYNSDNSLNIEIHYRLMIEPIDITAYRALKIRVGIVFRNWASTLTYSRLNKNVRDLKTKSDSNWYFEIREGVFNVIYLLTSLQERKWIYCCRNMWIIDKVSLQERDRYRLA